MIQYFYTLQNNHCNKFSYHLLAFKVIKIILSIFSLLYITSLRLITESLCFLSSLIYFTHHPTPLSSGNHLFILFMSLFLFCCLCSLFLVFFFALCVRLPRWRSWQRIRLPLLELQEMWVQSLGREDPLEWEMATHSSILAWKILWSELSGGLQSMESQRVRHDWAHTHKWNPKVFAFLWLISLSIIPSGPSMLSQMARVHSLRLILLFY